jgi:hypothetical protein
MDCEMEFREVKGVKELGGWMERCRAAMHCG